MFLKVFQSQRTFTAEKQVFVEKHRHLWCLEKKSLPSLVEKQKLPTLALIEFGYLKS